MTRIAICAPATAITPDHARAIEQLVADEFPEHSVYVHPQCFETWGHFAGDDLTRLTALLDCANDPQFDVVRQGRLRIEPDRAGGSCSDERCRA